MIHTHHSIQVIAGTARETDDAIVIEDRFVFYARSGPVRYARLFPKNRIMKLYMLQGRD